MKRLFFTLFLIHFSLFTIVGCSDNTAPGKVKGLITLDGKPLSGANVAFHPQAGSGMVSLGASDASGNYQLYYADGKTGALPGSYKVTVSTAAPHLDIPETVPQKYVEVETTDLIFDVKSGANVINLELLSQRP